MLNIFLEFLLAVSYTGAFWFLVMNFFLMAKHIISNFPQEMVIYTTLDYFTHQILIGLEVACWSHMWEVLGSNLGKSKEAVFSLFPKMWREIEILCLAIEKKFKTTQYTRFFQNLLLYNINGRISRMKPCLVPLERALLLTVFGQVVVAPFEF